MLEGKTLNTVTTYGFHLNAFNRWLKFEKQTLDGMKAMDLLGFKEWMLKKGKSERTFNAVISCLRGYFDFLILHEVVKTNPVSNLLRIKVKSYKQERLTDEQIHEFYTYIDQLKPNIRTAFYLMIGSGARVGEVAHLTKEDITIEKEGRIFVDIQDAKWGSDRKIPIVFEKSALIVHDYLQSVDTSSLPVFRVSKRTLQTHATTFMQKTNIPFSCHVLRHTFATLLLEKSVPIEKIQYLLGHKTPSATAHYTQSAHINVLDLAPSIWQGER
ncbi:integrase (plasmid) [Psychrobacillus glaciei]|uniref:Integrase n=1 Tax=Psychrobacillus glaciei TaxID=2283160 RepID=A0A5J6SY74_9BACI|nr:tyrosine-type recombinase/integrase [Psychrobacillus glaciei]QFG01288.1 integrase [Psychrobacillus glaciei]